MQNRHCFAIHGIMKVYQFELSDWLSISGMPISSNQNAPNFSQTFQLIFFTMILKCTTRNTRKNNIKNVLVYVSKDQTANHDIFVSTGTKIPYQQIGKIKWF